MFLPASTGAGFVAAYFRGFAVVGHLCILCIIVHGGRIFFGGWLGGLWVLVHADFSDIERDLFSGLRRRDGFADDEHSGFQTGRGGGFGIVEDGVEGLQGAIEPVLGLVAEEKGAVILSVGERFAEKERVAAPIGDGVAVNAGLGRGVRHINAFREGVDDDELWWCESFVKHSIHFLAPA